MNFLSDPVTFIATWLKGVFLGWGASEGLTTFLLSFIGAAVLAAGSMLWCIFLIWLERKLLGRIQDRLGPNRVGPFGLFQPIADMLKIFTKEYITPKGADVIPYNLAPVMAVMAVLLLWSVVPLTSTTWGVNLNVGILFLVAVGALGELGIIMAGWSSRNKFAMLGAFRVVAQLISYEVPMVLSLLVPVLLARSMYMTDIVTAQNPWFVVTAPLAALIFLITGIAEVGRSPFDLIEAESEIVAGFNIEYSGLKFGMFYVAEFLHAFTAALLFATVFLGGWRGPGAQEIPILGFIYLGIKTMVVYFLTVLIRGSLPRFRIDQMMDLNWKILTPLALVVVAVTALVDKAYASGATLMRVGAFLVTNLVVLLAAAQIMRWFALRRKAKLVGFETDEDDDTAVKPERASA
jgi:NADH-quinone oxidoreductase subunit H